MWLETSPQTQKQLIVAKLDDFSVKLDIALRETNCVIGAGKICQLRKDIVQNAQAGRIMLRDAHCVPKREAFQGEAHVTQVMRLAIGKIDDLEAASTKFRENSDRFQMQQRFACRNAADVHQFRDAVLCQAFTRSLFAACYREYDSLDHLL